MTEDEQGPSRERSKAAPPADSLSSQRVFKKSAPNNKITLYLSSRDLVITDDKIEKLHGVLVVDPDYVQQRKVYGQVTLTFRYGREDEEVMGLKFCNEAIMCLAQLYPCAQRSTPEPTTPLQDALLKRLGQNAHPFTMEVTPLAPPSVQLVPAKEYSGAPIGTSYDVRVYVADRPDEKLHRRSTIRMGIRVVQRASPSQLPAEPAEGAAQKPFLLSEGRVHLRATLDRAAYCHGDDVLVNVSVQNSSSRTVRRVKVFAVQHVDVCMFSNGKFKNVVAMATSGTECPIAPGGTMGHTYILRPAKSATKNWIALEDSFNRACATLACTVTAASNSPDERNVFAIYVSYYVKVKLLVGPMGGELSVKLPFTLVQPPNELKSVPTVQPAEEQPQMQPQSEASETNEGNQNEATTKEEEDLIVQCSAGPP